MSACQTKATAASETQLHQAQNCKVADISVLVHIQNDGGRIHTLRCDSPPRRSYPRLMFLHTIVLFLILKHAHSRQMFSLPTCIMTRGKHQSSKVTHFKLQETSKQSGWPLFLPLLNRWLFSQAQHVQQLFRRIGIYSVDISFRQRRPLPSLNHIWPHH